VRPSQRPMNYQKMSSIESDFADHPGDGEPGAFIVWLIPILWPFLVVRILLSIAERGSSPPALKWTSARNTQNACS